VPKRFFCAILVGATSSEGLLSLYYYTL